jgi:hypothetical protein
MMRNTVNVMLAAVRALSGRRQVGLGIHVALVAALVPGYALLAPPSRWNDPVMLIALAALGVIAIRTEVRLPAGISFEALSALALIATALAGPLPALLTTLAPIVVNALTGRERLLRAGNLANLAAYGWYSLAGAALIHAVAPEATVPAAFGWLLVVGLVQLLINWAFGPAIYVTMWLGQPVRTVLHVLADGVPTGAVMVLLGAGTVMLTPSLGVLALALFAVIAILPQTALTYVARTRPVARLEPATATRRYAHAIALQLGLSRLERRRLAAVVAAAHRRRPTGDPIDYAAATMVDQSPANMEAQLVTEWFNGRGGPIGLDGQNIPLGARIVAVADTWAGLTARGTPQLGHHDALAHLEAAAAARLDPAVVDAARVVVAEEPVTAADPAPEPRLHRLGLPAAVRRALAGA